MKKVYILIGMGYFVLAIIIILVWFEKITPDPREEFLRMIKFNEIENYQGIIIEKFIDRKDHNHSKLILDHNGTFRTIILDYELIDIYNFLAVGDSIKKTKGTLFLNVYRNDMDTVLNIQFKSLELLKQLEK